MQTQPLSPQLTLLQDDPAEQMELLILDRARRMYLRSQLLRQRHRSFEDLMADPTTGRCIRMAATALVRKAQQTQSH
jgi:hypothetical protein